MKKCKNLYTFIFICDEGVEKIYFCGIYGRFSIFYMKNREKKCRIILFGHEKIFFLYFCTVQLVIESAGTLPDDW